MKILLLGSNGMLGHALSSVLAAEDLVVGDLPDFDITDFQKLEHNLHSIKPEIIINASGYTNVDGCETDQENCLAVNSTGVQNLVTIAKKLGCILVHYSTDYVFDGQNINGYAEDAIPHPINVYGQSKFAGEQAIVSNLTKYYLIRSSWLFGPFGKNFVKTIVEKGKPGGELTVVDDQIGNPTFTFDLAQATYSIINEKKPFGIYHQTNLGKCSWFEFAQKIKQLTNFPAVLKPIKSNQSERSAKRPLYTILLNTKLPPLRSWEEALEDYIKNF